MRLAARHSVLMLALLAGCKATSAPAPSVPHLATPAAPVAPMAAPVAAPVVAPRLLPLPAAGARTLVSAPGGGNVAGQVAFLAVNNAFFANNAASYRIADNLPSANALLALADLNDELFAKDGQVATGLSDSTGAFTLEGFAPTDRPYVIEASLARGHRLSTLVATGDTGVSLNEATSMVVETARWQVRDTAATKGQKSLADLTLGVLADLNRLSAGFVKAADFASSGSQPTIAPLQQGAGFVLRNLYVAAFGQQVDASGTSDADRLSDLWKTFLGFRPLGLTRAIGNGNPSIVLDEGLAATETTLFEPRDVVEDAAGTMYVSEPAVGRVRCVPATNGPAFLASNQAMTAGHLYTVAGVANGPNTPDAFNAVYRTAEQAAVADPTAAPPVYDTTAGAGFALFAPGRLAVGGDGGSTSLYVTSGLGRRLFFLPSSDVSNVYGRSFKANHLYTLIGTGDAPAAGHDPAADNGLAGYQVPLSGPQALTRDDAGNVWLIDGTGLRVLRVADGKLFTLGATLAGSALSLADGHDLKLHAGTVYVALTARHAVVSFPAPNLAALGNGPVAASVAQVVLGKPDEAGFLAPGVAEPAFQDVALPVDQASVRLTSPEALAFDASGNMWVADAGRVRQLSAAGLAGSGGQVTTVAGGLQTSYEIGDARLASMPGNAGLFVEASGNVLVVDNTLDAVRRLWTSRGL